ncbi:hypothetical protein BJY01DRAFT_218609 [Aspergillus pseudoustus]|uniref:Uncharacterized protein n=1 Tax=Aspergillus pseudoustus TaxID=1810923 RepID=A0ABR4JJU8_9EURO
MENMPVADIIERLNISGPFDPLIVKIMAAIYTGRASRYFMKPSRLYEETLGMPAPPTADANNANNNGNGNGNDAEAALALLANMYSIYEFAYGMLIMWVHGKGQYAALALMIQMSALIHVAFAGVVYLRGNNKKSYTNLAFAALFGVWCYWSRCALETSNGVNLKDYKITVNYSGKK